MPTLAAQTGPPRSTRKGRCAARVLIWPTAAPLVRNSPRGWAPKTLPDLEVRVGRANARSIVGDTATRRHGDTPQPTRRHSREEGVRQPGISNRFRIALVCRQRSGRRGTTPTALPPTPPHRRERPWCPPSRRVPHKWSGRRPNRYMGRVSGLSLSNAEDLSEQRGWTPRSPRETLKCKERWRKPSLRGRRRALRKVPGLKPSAPAPGNPRRTVYQRTGSIGRNFGRLYALAFCSTPYAIAMSVGSLHFALKNTTPTGSSCAKSTGRVIDG